jgi:molybdate transport system regulatory protein
MPAKKPLALDSALGQASADKRVEILRRVAGAGSISEAARAAGVSYKAAWQALDTLSNLAGAQLVERAVGGAGGGGARLTEAGRHLLAAADEMARARSAVLARLGAGKRQPLAALALRTSMRNQLPCRIASLRTRAGAVEVRLELAGGGELVSRITRESSQLLGLAKGLTVLALCKAMAVQIRRASQGTNVLKGTISRAVRGGGEVALELEGGLHVVGFGTALKVGQVAVAVVDPAAVVIALPI